MRISDWSSDVCSSDLFNATMSPNGTMRVYSGLLLRVRSEAELAAVLGHEFGHFEKRPSLMQFKAASGGSDLLAWSALLASMSPSYNTQRAYQDLPISVRSEERRVGKECVSTCRSWRAPDH